MAENAALIQVLGAIAYGELKAYDGAKAEAESATTDDERRWHRQVAAEELRHHKGFVKRLEALGADPERAMAPYRGPLNRFHAYVSDDPIEDAVFAYLGEGIADDLLQWLQKVADPETVAFVDTVIADEVGHEAAATKVLRELLDVTPNGRARAARAARVMQVTCSGRGGRGQRRSPHSCVSDTRPSCCASSSVVRLAGCGRSAFACGCPCRTASAP